MSLNCRTALIFLHGSGSSGTELNHYLSCIPLGEHFRHDTFYQTCEKRNIQIFTPTAQKRPYSPALRMPMNVWFDRSSNYLEFALEDEEDESGVEISIQTIRSIVSAMEADYDHIFIGGFSMGGGLSLHFLRQKYGLSKKVRGLYTIGSFILNKSCILENIYGDFDDEIASKSIAELNLKSKQETGEEAFVLASSQESKNVHDESVKRYDSSPTKDDKFRKPAYEVSKGLHNVPVLMMHGMNDSLIKQDWGKSSATNLLIRGIDVRYQAYDGLDHEIGETQLIDLLIWIENNVLYYENHKASNEHNKDVAMGIDEEEDGNLKSSGDEHVPVTVPAQYLNNREKDVSEKHGGGKDYKFTVEELEPNKFNIIYPVNENLIGMLCSRPVLVQGGMFDIMPHGSNKAVYTTIMSPDPNRLATEIGKRLKNRIESDGDSLNACPMS